MKIKCPGCASLLEIPDSAAGKVVKCKCGKQLRAPAAKAPAGGSSTGAATSAVKTGPAPAAAGPGIFDELTESDLSGVKAVSRPGVPIKQANPNAATAKLLEEAISGSDRRAKGLLMKGETPRPPFLIFLGIINFMAAIFWFGMTALCLGLVQMLPAVGEGEYSGMEGTVFYLVAIGLGMLGALSLGTGIACFVRGRIPWYIVLISYGWGMADRSFRVIAEAMSDDVNFSIIGSIFGVLVSVGIWYWLHTESVKAYYKVETEPVWRIAVVDSVGFVLGAGLGAAILLMA